MSLFLRLDSGLAQPPLSQGVPAGTSFKLTVSDVLAWSISETWVELRKVMPLWANQGTRHQKHDIIWQQTVIECRDDLENLEKSDLEQYLEDDARVASPTRTTDQSNGPSYAKMGRGEWSS